ncbi:Pumilio domain-containing protein C14orf21-like [Papilio machaon]|uniref:Pumilio domain-containing protein C14orf21-like n=1 Tax=Papilio machaon TaxID=76193 RepID=A0A0N1PG39_PAPMA|nr:Pumilio domain-containing protein C14orf21-like [Papilio machaon]
MSEENFDTTESKAGEQTENNPQKRKWQALVNNVLERTKGEELNIIGNQLGCRVIELLIPYSTSEDLERYIEVVNTDLRRLCSDNFCGYVLNSMLTVCSHRATDHLQNDNQEIEDEVPKKKRKKEQDCKYSEEHVKNCHEFVIKISKYVLNNLEDFVWEPNTNYMVRTVLKCLSGINLLPGEKPKVNLFKEPILQNKGIPPHQSDVKYRNVPEDFTEIVKEFGNRLSLWPQFKDLPFENMTSALLQVLLFAVKNADKTITKHLIKKLLNESFAPDDWVSEGADDKKDDEKDSKDDDKNEVNGDNTLSSNLPPVFQSEAAHLEAVLKCTEDGDQKYFSVLCLRLQPLDKVDVNKLSEEYFIHIHGSIILQTILDFQRPTKAISSVLSLSGEELLVVLTDAKGCHVADALCTGQFVGVKSRDKLVKKLKGYYQKLALSQHGSRAFEQIFEASSPEQQVAIMTELSDKSNLLNGSQYGRIIATKYDLNTFKLSQKAWEKARKKAKKNQD